MADDTKPYVFEVKNTAKKNDELRMYNEEYGSETNSFIETIIEKHREIGGDLRSFVSDEWKGISSSWSAKSSGKRKETYLSSGGHFSENPFNVAEWLDKADEHFVDPVKYEEFKALKAEAEKEWEEKHQIEYSEYNEKFEQTQVKLESWYEAHEADVEYHKYAGKREELKRKLDEAEKDEDKNAIQAKIDELDENKEYCKIREEYEQIEEERKNLKEEYATVIEERGKHEEKIEEIEKSFSKYIDRGITLDNIHPQNFYDDVEILNKLPDKVLNNIVEYYEQCKTDGKLESFRKTYAEFVLSAKAMPTEYEHKTPGKAYKNEEEEKADRVTKVVNGVEEYVIKNEYALAYNKEAGRNVLTIRNLDGTGLNVAWINGKFGFTAVPEKITEEQAKALAKYCFETGIEFENYKDLQDLKVVDKDGKPLKDEDDNNKPASDYIKEEMARLNGFEREQENSSECSSEINTDTSEAGWDIPYPEPKKPSRQSMERAATKRLGMMGFHESKQLRVNRYGGTTVISVYMNEDDMREDGKLDANRNRKRTKQFAVTLRKGPPASGSIYMPPGKEMKADHARVMLDAFKAQGYKYVSIPEAAEAGKVGRGAFLQACVKNGMIPVCKPNPGGTVLGAPDLETIFKAMEEEPMSVDEKTEFQMRLYQQLEKSPNFTNGAINPRAMKLKYGANFNQFTNSHITSLTEFIQDGVDGKHGEKWDQIDRAAAVSALTHIVKDIEKGTLNGKSYNPLAPSGQNLEAIQKAMIFYMGQEKQGIVKAVNKALNEEKKESAQDSKINSALRTVCGKRDEDLKQACSALEAYGVKFSIPVPKAEERGYNGPDYSPKIPSLPNEGLRQAYIQGRSSPPTPTNQGKGGSGR